MASGVQTHISEDFVKNHDLFPKGVFCTESQEGKVLIKRAPDEDPVATINPANNTYAFHQSRGISDLILFFDRLGLSPS